MVFLIQPILILLSYPAESISAVIPRPIQGIMLIVVYTIIFSILIVNMLRCGKAKPK